MDWTLISPEFDLLCRCRLMLDEVKFNVRQTAVQQIYFDGDDLRMNKL